MVSPRRPFVICATWLDLNAMRTARSRRPAARADGAKYADWENMMAGTLHRTHSLRPRAMGRGGAGLGDLAGSSEHDRLGNAINRAEDVLALATARAGLNRPPIMPVEASAALGMLLMERPGRRPSPPPVILACLT